MLTDLLFVRSSCSFLNLLDMKLKFVLFVSEAMQTVQTPPEKFSRPPIQTAISNCQVALAPEQLFF